MQTYTNPSKYCAKEYLGDRPCIHPLAMAELMIMCGAPSPASRPFLTKLKSTLINICTGLTK